MAKKVLVTGGAGFIGSHIVDELIRRGYSVRILDNMDHQVPYEGKAPQYIKEFFIFHGLFSTLVWLFKI